MFLVFSSGKGRELRLDVRCIYSLLVRAEKQGDRMFVEFFPGFYYILLCHCLYNIVSSSIYLIYVL